VAVSVTSQLGTAGTAVGAAPSVRVVANDGQPLAGTTVSFQVTSGGGSVSGAMVVSGADGVATVGSWVLGTLAGANGLTASTGALTVGFDATGAAGPPSQIVAVSGSQQTGTIQTTLPMPFVARVMDQYGNAVAGAAVTFNLSTGTTPNASLSATTASSASDGTVSTTLTLGDSAGWHDVFVNGAFVTGQRPSFAALAEWRRLNAVGVASRYAHACAAGVDGRAYCWGEGGSGQIGDGGTTTRYIATVAGAGLALKSVAAGFDYSCGLASDGTAYCWGLNDNGQLGDGSVLNRSVPTPVAGGLKFQQLSVGYRTSCGVTTANAVYCWGSNSIGILGAGIGGDGWSTVPVAVQGGLQVASVAVALSHACALTTTGSIYCWGRNLYGETGAGDTTYRHDVPVAVAVPAGSFTALAIGDFSSCGLDTQGAALCWGGNGSAQLGVPEATATSLTPIAVTGGKTFKQLFALASGYCGVAAAGDVSCWGHEPWEGSAYPLYWTATPVPELAGLTAITGGSGHLCGIRASGTVVCRGNGGVSGDGLSVDHWVTTMTNVRAP
jgi:alpha-tubulin suppressor-like RCC1 family protein